jgi:hypothetical protein
MARTTHPPAHRHGAALNGCVPPQQPTPAQCPTWCVGGHEGPDPQHYGAWLHEDTPHVVRIEDGEVSISISRFDELERPWPHSIGQTTVTLAFDDVDAPRVAYDMTFDQAQELITELLDVMNRAQPPAQQQFLGRPGFEYVPDEPWI